MDRTRTTEHNWAKVNVVSGCGRAVDDHRAYHSSRILSRVVGMVPSGAIQAGHELVCKAFAGRNGALGDSWCSILPWGPLLKEAMPVNNRSLFRSRYVVVNCHDNLVTPVGFDQRPGKSTVDEENISLVSIRRDHPTTKGEFVVSDNTSSWPVPVWVGTPVGKLTPRIAMGQRVVGEEKGEEGRYESS